MISAMLSRLVASPPVASRPAAARQAVVPYRRPDVFPARSELSFTSKSEFTYSSQSHTNLQNRSDVGFNSAEFSLASSSEVALFSPSSGISFSTHQVLSVRTFGHGLEEETPVPCACAGGAVASPAVPEARSDPVPGAVPQTRSVATERGVTTGSANTGNGTPNPTENMKWLASVLAWFGLVAVGVKDTEAVVQDKNANSNWSERVLSCIRFLLLIAFLVSLGFLKDPMYEAWCKSLETPLKILKDILECLKALKG